MQEKVTVKYVKGGKIVSMPRRYARPLLGLGIVILEQQHAAVVETHAEDEQRPVIRARRSRKALEQDSEQE